MLECFRTQEGQGSMCMVTFLKFENFHRGHPSAGKVNGVWRHGATVRINTNK